MNAGGMLQPQYWRKDLLLPSTVSIPSLALGHLHEGVGYLVGKEKAGKPESETWVWGDTAEHAQGRWEFLTLY